MSTVVVQVRVGVISAVARVAAIGCLHAYRKGSWSPGIRIPFLKKEKTRIFHGQPNAALPRERSDSPAVCPAQVAFSWLDRSAPRVASAAKMAALILNPARHGAPEMRPLARAAGFRQCAQVLLAAAACSIVARECCCEFGGIAIWRHDRFACLCRTTTRTVTTIQSARVRVQSSESEELWQAAGSRQVGRALIPWQVLILYGNRPTH